MREALIKEGGLTGATVHQPVLKERNVTSIKLRSSLYYARNDVIRFNHTLSRYNIKAGDYLTVGEVTSQHKRKNTLSLTRENGKQLTLPLAALPKFKAENKDLERPIEIYRRAVLPLMVGDRVQFKRNSESIGIRNSELATINAITP